MLSLFLRSLLVYQNILKNARSNELSQAPKDGSIEVIRKDGHYEQTGISEIRLERE